MTMEEKDQSKHRVFQDLLLWDNSINLIWIHKAEFSALHRTIQDDTACQKPNQTKCT